MIADEFGPPDATGKVHERSLWLGTPENPIFARLTTPVTSSIGGGLLISPPIGRESRAARRTLRLLAESIAGEGFAVLRYDHFGTSDSSGGFDDDRFFVEWTEQIRRGVEFLRSLGAPAVSALGMRLGATILGRAAQLQNLDLSSVVLWDPCESGRSYLRERAAFEATAQEDDRPESTRANEKSEFVYREETKETMRTLTLLEVEPEKLAHRILILTRDDRVTSSKLTRQFDAVSVEWDATDEQSALLEVELPFAKLPVRALRRIEDWIVMSKVDGTPLRATSEVTTSPVDAGPGPMSVRERAIAVGPRGLFAIASEPVGEANGPWIVMVNGANEDHVGPSRLWVDLSRRWSSYGLRCVRFDFMGLGESPRSGIDPSASESDDPELADINDVIRALSPDDPSNAVLIGLCSGAHVALRAALQLHSRGVCTINPQVGPALLRTADRLEESEHSLFRRVRQSVKDQPWIGKLVWQMCRVVLPTAYSLKVRKALAEAGTEMLLIVSPQDINPFPRTPILRSLDQRRLIPTTKCRIDIVPDMDHDFLNSEGRAKAVAILDDHILNIFSS
jgi:pimeloyl-ACP methyl ester carboxylesterase